MQKISSRTTAARLHPALKPFREITDRALNTFDTPIGRNVNVFLILLIIVSTGVFVLDTIPELSMHAALFGQIEAFVAIIFTVEYLLRLWIAPRPRWKYATGMYAVFDLLAIVPFYLGYLPLGFLRTFRMLRMLRVLRVLRLLKLSRHLTRKLTKAQKEASAFKVEMQILAIGMVTVVLIFSGLMYAIENPAGSKGFESVLSTMWYVMVTITTIGYGDVTPATAFGKFIATFIMLAGIGLIGTFTGIIGKAMMSKLAINTKTLEKAPAESAPERTLDHHDRRFERHVVVRRSCGRCNDRVHHATAQYCKSCGAYLER